MNLLKYECIVLAVSMLFWVNPQINTLPLKNEVYKTTTPLSVKNQDWQEEYSLKSNIDFSISLDLFNDPFEEVDLVDEISPGGRRVILQNTGSEIQKFSYILIQDNILHRYVGTVVLEPGATSVLFFLLAAPTGHDYQFRLKELMTFQQQTRVYPLRRE